MCEVQRLVFAETFVFKKYHFNYTISFINLFLLKKCHVVGDLFWLKRGITLTKSDVIISNEYGSQAATIERIGTIVVAL